LFDSKRVARAPTTVEPPKDRARRHRRATEILAAGLLAACGLQEHPQRQAVSTEGPEETTNQDAAAPPPAPVVDAGTAQDRSATGVDGSAPAQVSPPPPTGPGVTIEGMFVPQARAIAIVHFGHSNMLGRASTPEELRPFFLEPQAGLWSYQGQGRFVAAREPTSPPPNGRAAGRYGPGMAILRTLAARAPAGHQFISIGLGVGSATTADFAKGGLYYDTFARRAAELRGKVTFAAIFVMLGITDRHMPAAEQGGFADRMVAIIEALRAELGEPDLPVLHTDYEVESSGPLAPGNPFPDLVRPLILSLPGRLPNLAIIPTDDITMQDDHHFDFAGQKLWAERGVEIMTTRRWLPWLP
jgi:hypothetical protein